MPTSTAPLWTSQDLRNATQGRLTGDVHVRAVCIDTRSLQPGDLFIALIGHNADGHQYLKQALEHGAACVMAHDGAAIAKAGLTDDPRLLLVSDTMQALEALGRYRRAQFKGKAIAITGSVGKTTTKNMLATALAAYGKVHASVASFNNHWGVPLTLARLPQDAAFCISEVGMNHPGEITPLVAQIRPDIGLITTIGSAHLGHMGSLNAIAAEKASLFAALPAGGTALCPEEAAQFPAVTHAIPQDVSLWQVGTTSHATIHCDELHCTATGSQLHLSTPAGEAQLTLTAPGPHLARNAALALGAVAALGLPPQAGATALRHFQPEAGRGQQRLLPGEITLLDESYNASGPSIRAALETLSLMPAPRHIAALGDIRELGTFAAEEHRALAQPLTEHNILTFCCGPHMKSLYEALPRSLQGGYAETSTQLALLLRPALQKGDVLLVKGSLGSRMRDLIALLDQPESSHSPEST
ncbi:UDP-N-acetylmuramoyl-tripeptide--D-alanyl-D-alanine ligase [Bombella sp. ESL0385]|uniref:UDP-N-acetylmuramoyl-tripeptide--D-alanyl-D- alanine ligase n=1 Tax=Bombella sp. ESL0385 TaxID=2676446 RepID=UPI0012D9BE73|nr:UDP-N-acetylmuramoyl-tripeptide--D-alanyl-D-alanine ligase [Bombella sp. ESL0385]MUG90418.1 UDP-N-acetylmuramoyl-tripeptide--D-alanyl-D-alanine ligase [Bombella sp. ESL0385]